MDLTRRGFLGTAGAATACLAVAPAWAISHGDDMYGLIGRMTAAPGQRDALVETLLGSIHGMPGCLSYVVALDPSDAAAVWITEVWDSQASHEASLGLPAVRDAIAKARPLIAGFGEQTVTVPVGGHGLLAGSPTKPAEG